jgi:hypothetical protein
MNRAVRKGRSLTPEVRHRGFIYATFGLGASHTGLWAYGLGLEKKPARASLAASGSCKGRYGTTIAINGSEMGEVILKVLSSTAELDVPIGALSVACLGA